MADINGRVGAGPVRGGVRSSTFRGSVTGGAGFNDELIRITGELHDHINDDVRHITEEERRTWNKNSVTAEAIGNALGYTPADAEALDDLAMKVDGYAFKFDEVSGEAYELPVPDRALKYAMLDRVGAKTVRNDRTLVSCEPNKVTCIGADGTRGKTIDVSEIVSKYFPEGMKSAMDVCDEIDLERGTAIKRIGKIEITEEIVNTLVLYIGTGTKYYRTNGTPGTNILPVVTNGRALKMIIDRPLTATYANAVYPDGSEAGLIASNTNGRICISYGSYVSLNALKADLLGATIYYEYMGESNIPQPIETPITEQIDRQLIVEPGGKIVFESANPDEHVPLPNAETFMVKL